MNNKLTKEKAEKIIKLFEAKGFKKVDEFEKYANLMIIMTNDNMSISIYFDYDTDLVEIISNEKIREYKINKLIFEMQNNEKETV